MAGAAHPERRDMEFVFERIAEVIDRQRRCALIEHAMVERIWHWPAEAITDCAGPESFGDSRHAA